jgi:DNA-binding transcriptional MerR regulator
VFDMENKSKFTVGHLAKQANVSVRTIQYYDKISLLKPSDVSEGGRRLYDNNDIAMLHQIITLKSFGLSLEEIKERLMPINSSQDVVKVLNKQSLLISEQISKANKLLESMEMLKKDIINSKKVDWSKYSKMLKLVKDNNEYYWVTNFLDEGIISDITVIHEDNEESIDWLMKCLDKANVLIKKGIGPKSEQAQELAKEIWQYVQKYSKGKEETIMQLYEFYRKGDQWPSEFGETQKKSQKFMEKAIKIYLLKSKLHIPINKK